MNKFEELANEYESKHQSLWEITDSMAIPLKRTRKYRKFINK